MKNCFLNWFWKPGLKGYNPNWFSDLPGWKLLPFAFVKDTFHLGGQKIQQDHGDTGLWSDTPALDY